MSAHLVSKCTHSLTTALLLFLAYLGFLVAFALSPVWLLWSLAYLLFAILAPGYLLAAVLNRALDGATAQARPAAAAWIAQSTIFGLFACLVSYLAAMLLSQPALNFSFVLAYGILIHPGILRDVTDGWRQLDWPKLGSPATVFSLLVLAAGMPIMMMRPTPGIVPVDIFQDHLWNTGNTVALLREFPLHSLNIETRPAIAYHILVHVLGAHLSRVTSMPAYLAGLQYVYVPLTILLILNGISVLRTVLGERQRYLLFGAAVLFFGSGLTVLHEIKVGGLLNSSTNLIGIVVFLAWVGLQTKAGELSPVLRAIAVFTAVFLATVAKGSVGAGLAGGTILWFLARAWKRDLPKGSFIEAAAAGSGFVLSYLLFFSALVVAAHNAPPARELLEGQTFALAPFSYVIQNPLVREVVVAIDRFLSGPAETAAHAALIVLMLPLHILFYYSYRLLPFIDRKSWTVSYLDSRLLFVFLSAALVAYLVPGAPTDHAYFLAPGLFGLDIIFVTWAYRVGLLDRILRYFRTDLFALIGSLAVVTLPFVSVAGWFRPEYVLNFVTSGHVGQLLDARMAGTSYRREHGTITPELYAALRHIGTSLPESTVVVTPFIDLPDGRPLAYFTSALSERPAYLEGYGFAVSGAVPAADIDVRLAVIEDLYDRRIVSDSLRDGRHVVLASTTFLETAERTWSPDSFEVDYRNSEWAVIILAPQTG